MDRKLSYDEWKANYSATLPERRDSFLDSIDINDATVEVVLQQEYALYLSNPWRAGIETAGSDGEYK